MSRILMEVSYFNPIAGKMEPYKKNNIIRIIERNIYDL